MTLTEYCDVLNIEMDIKYHPNQGGRWSACFSDSEIKDGSVLISSFGNGNSPVEAIDDYLKKIKGKLLVTNAYQIKNRREFLVPTSLRMG